MLTDRTEKQDSAKGPFLALLGDDLTRHPERLTSPGDQRSKLLCLICEVEFDLLAQLTPEEEEDTHLEHRAHSGETGGRAGGRAGCC